MKSSNLKMRLTSLVAEGEARCNNHTCLRNASEGTSCVCRRGHHAYAGGDIMHMQEETSCICRRRRHAYAGGDMHMQEETSCVCRRGYHAYAGGDIMRMLEETSCICRRRHHAYAGGDIMHMLEKTSCICRRRHHVYAGGEADLCIDEKQALVAFIMEERSKREDKISQDFPEMLHKKVKERTSL